MKKIFKNKGFTTFELLVVIFVIALISSVLIVSWRKSERRYQVENAAQEIIQNIRKVQDMALNSFDYDPDPLVPPPPCYGISFDANEPNLYRIFADLDGDKTCCSVNEDALNGTGPINMPSGVEIYNPCKKPDDPIPETEIDVHITFTIPDGFATVDPAHEGLGPPQESNGVLVRIRKIGGTCPEDCRAIRVDKTGRVSLENWVVCDNDP